MKTVLKLVGMTLCGALLSCNVLAGSYHWVGGDLTVGGGWNVAGNWIDDATQTPAVPLPGSTVVITNSVVANDDDAALFCSLKSIHMDKWSSSVGAVLTLDVSTNVTLSCAINGKGRFVKKGLGTATLTAHDSSDRAVLYQDTYGVYYLIGGDIYIEEGTLELSQSSAFVYNYGDVHVSLGATVVLCANKTTCIEGLHGDGLVRQDGTTECELQIGWSGIPRSQEAVFAGKLTGNLKLTVWGNQVFTGEENDFTGAVESKWGKGSESFGRLGAGKLGEKGEPSSLGAKDRFVFLSYGAHFKYVGQGETSDREFVTEARANTGLLPQYFDAGTNGGLRLTGLMEVRDYGSAYNMRSFVFTGSNTVACTMAGPFNLGMTGAGDVRYDFYVRKEGPGEWAFEENANTTFRGVFDVREGTLSFDSLANAGTVCSLGYSTRLSDEFVGSWNDAHLSRYAFRVGTTNLVDAAPAVFSFVGSNSCACADRPLLLTADAHFRANGKDGASVDFSDVSASAGSVVKTLTLDGTNMADNVMRKIADGDGRVSVVKDGSGKWTLRGDQTFSGTLSVKKGELAVHDRVPYSWYRLTIRENVGKGDICAINRLAFYDASGKLLTKDISFVNGAAYGTDANYYYAVDPTTLLAGQSCWAPFSTTPEYDNYYSKLTKEDPSVMFAGGGVGGSRIYYRIGSSTQSFKSSNPGARLVIRLPEGSEEAVRYDVSAWIPQDSYKSWQISAWTVEGSSDGINWDPLDKIDGMTDIPENGAWYSEPNKQATSEDRPNAGFVMDVPECADQLTQVESVSVAQGARLTFGAECTTPVIGKIAIDGASGAGVICGGSFATDLVVDVTGDIPRRGGTFPVDFTQVGNIDNIQPTFMLNGEPSKKYSFRLTATELTILPPGLMLIFR